MPALCHSAEHERHCLASGRKLSAWQMWWAAGSVTPPSPACCLAAAFSMGSMHTAGSVPLGSQPVVWASGPGGMAVPWEEATHGLQWKVPEALWRVFPFSHCTSHPSCSSKFISECSGFPSAVGWRKSAPDTSRPASMQDTHMAGCGHRAPLVIAGWLQSCQSLGKHLQEMLAASLEVT